MFRIESILFRVSDFFFRILRPNAIVHKRYWTVDEAKHCIRAAFNEVKVYPEWADSVRKAHSSGGSPEAIAHMCQDSMMEEYGHKLSKLSERDSLEVEEYVHKEILRTVNFLISLN